jgi:P-type Mg2+ transporter
MALAALGVATVGAVLPATPVAHALGFAPLPALFFAVLIGMIIGYLVLIEIGKRLFYGTSPILAEERPRYSQQRHLRRRAAYFSKSR